MLKTRAFFWSFPLKPFIIPLKKEGLKVKLILFLILMGCVSSPIKKSGEKNLPEWALKTDEFCEKKGFLCASAGAKESYKADLMAKSQLASIFESQIESSFSQEKTLSTGKDFIADIDLKEKLVKEVRERVSLILSGVKVLERARVGEEFYSLAGVERMKTIRGLRREVQKHDERLEYLWSKKKKTDIEKMREHYFKREMYAKRLRVLGPDMPSPVSLAQLDELKDAKITTGRKIFFEAPSVPEKIGDELRSYLSGLGYQFVLHRENADYLIRGELKKEKHYFKVKGFEKMGFTLTLRSFNQGGEEMGEISKHREGIGRTKEDAYRQVERIFLNEMKDNLNYLRLGE